MSNRSRVQGSEVVGSEVQRFRVQGSGLVKVKKRKATLNL